MYTYLCIRAYSVQSILRDARILYFCIIPTPIICIIDAAERLYQWERLIYGANIVLSYTTRVYDIYIGRRVIRGNNHYLATRIIQILQTGAKFVAAAIRQVVFFFFL